MVPPVTEFAARHDVVAADDVGALPADGFFISCFPHKIRGASAGWTRAVAIFDDALQATAA